MSDTSEQSGTQWFSIPYLPDVLNDHELLEESKVGRLAEYLRNWTGALAAMDSFKDFVTVCLRFVGSTKAEQVQVYLGFRVDGDSADRVTSSTDVIVRDVFSCAGIELMRLDASKPLPFSRLQPKDAIFHITQSIERPQWEDPVTENELSLIHI